MTNKKELNKLKKRLFGEFVVAVKESDRPNALFKITTGNGKDFHLFANDIGFWIEDDKDLDGFYPDLNSFFLAIENKINTYLIKNKTKNNYIESIITDDHIFEAELITGEILKINIDKIKNRWERKVLKHVDLLEFINPILNKPWSWKSFFSVKYKDIVGKDVKIPKDLLRRFLK